MECTNSNNCENFKAKAASSLEQPFKTGDWVSRVDRIEVFEYCPLYRVADVALRDGRRQWLSHMGVWRDCQGYRVEAVDKSRFDAAEHALKDKDRFISKMADEMLCKSKTIQELSAELDSRTAAKDKTIQDLNAQVNRLVCNYTEMDGRLTDKYKTIESQAREILRLRAELNDQLAKNTALQLENRTLAPGKMPGCVRTLVDYCSGRGAGILNQCMVSGLIHRVKEHYGE